MTKRRSLNCGPMWNSIGYRTQRNFFSPSQTNRGFWGASGGPAEAEIITESKPEKKDGDKKENNTVALPPQILVPVPDHPIFPGYSNVVALTEEQFTILKDTKNIFTTLVKNDELTNKDLEIAQQM